MIPAELAQLVGVTILGVGVFVQFFTEDVAAFNVGSQMGLLGALIFAVGVVV